MFMVKVAKKATCHRAFQTHTGHCFLLNMISCALSITHDHIDDFDDDNDYNDNDARDIVHIIITEFGDGK